MDACTLRHRWYEAWVLCVATNETKSRQFFLANRGRTALLNQITAALKLPAHPQKIKVPWQVLLYEAYGVRYNECACCKKLSLVLVKTIFREIELDST